MTLLHRLLAAAGDPPNLDWLGYTIPAAGGVVVAIVATVGTVWRRNQDRKDALADAAEEKKPTEKDGWAEVRAARDEATKYYNLYTIFRNAFYDVQAALRHLVRAITGAHPDMELDKDVVDALAIKPEDDTK